MGKSAYCKQFFSSLRARAYPSVHNEVNANLAASERERTRRSVTKVSHASPERRSLSTLSRSRAIRSFIRRFTSASRVGPAIRSTVSVHWTRRVLFLFLPFHFPVTNFSFHAARSPSVVDDFSSPWFFFFRGGRAATLDHRRSSAVWVYTRRNRGSPVSTNPRHLDQRNFFLYGRAFRQH